MRGLHCLHWTVLSKSGGEDVDDVMARQSVSTTWHSRAPWCYAAPYIILHIGQPWLGSTSLSLSPSPSLPPLPSHQPSTHQSGKLRFTVMDSSLQPQPPSIIVLLQVNNNSQSVSQSGCPFKISCAVPCQSVSAISGLSAALLCLTLTLRMQH